jgi:XTP/dITP diphosphohydrolase
MGIKILIATDNPGKVAEIEQIFANSDFEVLFKATYPDPKIRDLKIEENADNFSGNALIKAKTLGELTGLVTLGEDGGLCVDVLGGRPGVLSARYSGGGDKENCKKVLAEMVGIPEAERTCYYKCAVAIYDPQTQQAKTVFGRWDGRITLAPRGDKSFGYAPIFLSAKHNFKLTNAEIDEESKIAVNHRGQAFHAARKLLEEKYLALN